MKINYLLLVLFSLSILACNKESKPGIPPVSDSLTHILYNPSPYDLVVYDSFPEITIPADNPMTVDGVMLGRHLFYDPILSSDNSMSCSSCHGTSGNFTDNQATSQGVTGEFGNRSSMPLLDIAFNKNGFFWDGRAVTLEDQALGPVENPIELHDDWENVEEKLRNHDDYPTLFRKAFGIESKSEITKELAAKAIAQFERTMISPGNTKFDKWWRGEVELTDQEFDGFLMWIDYDGDFLPDAECGHCHTIPLFTTNEYHNNGLDEAPTMNEFPDLGLGEVTGVLTDNGKFRTPSLRNIELSAPYMHDGRFQTLEEVMDHYNSGGHYAPNANELILPLGLTEEMKASIIAFMKTLTDEDILQDPKFSSPF